MPVTNSKQSNSPVLAFEACLPDTHQIALKVKAGGEATLTLVVPQASVPMLAEKLPALEGRTFAVGISLMPLD